MATSIIILQQCIAGLEHLHSLGIIHRDIRAAHMLIAALDPLHVVVTGFHAVMSSRQVRVYAQVFSPAVLQHASCTGREQQDVNG